MQYMMTNVWGLGFFRAVTGIGMGFIMPVANTLIAQAVPSEKRSIVFGVVSSVVLMGNVAGPVCSGALAMVCGYAAVSGLPLLRSLRRALSYISISKMK